jgi:hypothetical protein
MEDSKKLLAERKSKFLKRWMIASGLGAAIGMIAFFALGLYFFLNNGVESPIPTQDLFSGGQSGRMLLGYLTLAPLLGFLPGLPFGLAQWLVIRTKFKSTVLWIFSYSFGLTAFLLLIVLGLELASDNNTFLIVLVLILGWLISSTVTGGIQAFILKGQIDRPGLLIPINILAGLVFGIAFALATILNLLLYFFGLLIGGFLAGLSHSAITGRYLKTLTKVPL